MVKNLMLVMSLITLLLPMGPYMAQAQGPGSGKVIVVANLEGSTTSLDSLNPLRTTLSSTVTIVSLMFPTVVGVSPFTQYYGKVGDEGVYNALATDWTISDDGLTYTFTLRQDAIWSDGAPITATDVKFSFDAIASGQSELYGYYNYDPDYNPFGITEVVVVDDYTFQAKFKAATCEALVAGTFPVAPAHVFGYNGSPDFDFSVIIGHEFDTNPSVVYGPFQLDYIHYGQEVALKTVPTWADGPVIPAGIIFRDVSSAKDATARFLAGEFDYVGDLRSCQTCFADLNAAPDVRVASFPSLYWDHISLNEADPNNPQPGLDAAGNLIDQGHHPFFSDVRVRRAMQLAIDVQTIIQEAVDGRGTQMASYLIPTSWAADPNLTPVPYDPALAAQLLDEAGWPLGPDGIRVCQGCEYALDGTPFAFELVANTNNIRRETIGAVIKEQLRTVGIEVNFRTEDYYTMVPNAQTYDAMVYGWPALFPANLELASAAFDPLNDLPEGGFNNTSYYNPEVMRLSEKALTLPGCDPMARADIYYQLQKLLQDEQPFLWLFAQNDLFAAHDYVIGFDPQPNMPWWNIHTWQVNR